MTPNLNSNRSKINAFSLIELSIVILIIGILVAGVTQSSRLVKQIRIQTIRNLTTNSPVLSIKDLNIWLKTSLEKSFDEAQQANGSAITSWFDNNLVSVDKNNATSPSSVNNPQYVENVFNSVIPAVRFDGVNDFMNFNGLFLLNNNFTFFVVEQRRSANIHQYYIGGATGNFHLGYSSSTSIRVGKYGAINSDFFDLAIPAYSSPIPRIHSFTHNSLTGKKYWLNGGLNPDAQSNNTSALTFYSAVIGQTEGNLFYSGDIAEIIVFSRDLKNDERTAIEDYLAKKYSILIS